MIKEKLKELELQLNYVCYDKELITRLSKVWSAYYELKSEVDKLSQPEDVKSVCDHNWQEWEDEFLHPKWRCSKCKIVK